MTFSRYDGEPYKRMDEDALQLTIKVAGSSEQALHNSLDEFDDTHNFRQLDSSPSTLFVSLFTMSTSNNQQNNQQGQQQGQGGRGSNTPTPTPEQPQTQAQTSTEQYPDHAAHNSSGSLQQAGAGVMQQQLGQYYLYMATTQAGQGNQAGRGSPSGSQGGQSSGSSQGR